MLRWVNEIGAVNPQTEMEIVMYGRGLALVVAGRSTMPDDVKAAIGRPHVAFKACEIAMKNQKVDRGELLPTVGTVPDGIGEIVARQNDGWGYIKVIHWAPRSVIRATTQHGSRAGGRDAREHDAEDRCRNAEKSGADEEQAVRVEQRPARARRSTITPEKPFANFPT